jgi:hypothetical protein
MCIYLAGFRVGSHTFIYLHDIWKHLWVLRDTILLQECVDTSWTWVCKEGRNSIVVQVLIGVCHMPTYCENKKACSHINLSVHTRNETRSPEKRVFLDSSHDQYGERLTDVKDIEVLDVYGTWKSVLLSPNRGCENTFCCLTPGLLTVLHVLLPLLPSFTQHFGWGSSKLKDFFTPSRTKWAKKNK